MFIFSLCLMIIAFQSLSPGLVETNFFNNMYETQETGIQFDQALRGTDIANTVVHVLGAPPHVEVS